MKYDYIKVNSLKTAIANAKEELDYICMLDIIGNFIYEQNRSPYAINPDIYNKIQDAGHKIGLDGYMYGNIKKLKTDLQNLEKATKLIGEAQMLDEEEDIDKLNKKIIEIEKYLV